MVKQKILEDLKKAVKDLGYPATDIVLSIPKNFSFGDYSTNVALQLTKQPVGNGKQTPDEIAKKIIERLQVTPLRQGFAGRAGYSGQYLEKVEVVNGFINFFIKNDILMENVSRICRNQIFEGGNLPAGKAGLKNKKILVEFTDPNPFKEFHIGHVFSNTIGESICRLLEAQGATVKRADYFGDVGMHVAKSIWGMQKKMKKEKIKIKNLEAKSSKERVKFLGEAYALGAKAYEEEREAQEEIKKINSRVYAHIKAASPQLEEIEELFEKGRKWSLDYFETIYSKLGTKFDLYYPESAVGEHGMKIVKEHMDDGIFEQSEGAVIFPGEKYGLHRRVFINSLGLPTYEAKELGLAVKKHQDFAYDQSIVVTGNEINEYFKVLLAALSQIAPELAASTRHIGHGMVRVPSGKLSSRTGKVLTFEWLFDEVKKKVTDLMEKSPTSKDINKEEKQQIADIVSIGAIKFALLKSSPHMDVVFDLEKSVSLEGDSGPYIQYTYARAKSVLKEANFEYSAIAAPEDLETEERSLLQKIDYFEVFAEEAAKNFAPNTLAEYILGLAKAFNLFYQKHRIIKSGEKQEFRLALTYSVAFVLKQGLYLLGIKAPERM